MQRCRVAEVVLTQHSLSADDVHDDVDDNGINKGHPNISTLFVMFFVVIKRKIFIIPNTSVTGTYRNSDLKWKAEYRLNFRIARLKHEPRGNRQNEP